MNEQTVYFNGRFCPLDQVRISPLDRGFLFADGVYEVVRAYGGKWFRLSDHAARLERSLAALELAGFDVAGLEGAGNELLKLNGLDRADALLYWQITRGAADFRAHAYPDASVAATVFGMVNRLPHRRPEEPAVVAALEDRRWSRCDIKSVALLGNVLSFNEARSQGAVEALFQRGGTVTEGASVNVAAVIDGTVRTHPESEYILSGISRKVALEICREDDIPCREEAFSLAELRRASEAFLTGTTHEIWPVRAVIGEALEWPAPGPVTRRLMARFSELIR